MHAEGTHEEEAAQDQREEIEVGSQMKSMRRRGETLENDSERPESCEEEGWENAER